MNIKVLLILIVSLSLVGCSYSQSKSSDKLEPTYQSIQANILGPKCYQCHAERFEPQAEPLNNFDLLSAKVSPYFPEDSPLFLHVATGSMPPEQPLTARERDAIYNWIRSGALNN